ncbi:hypothetical protein GCM10010174_61290 [Kutzneria viridogrisea]|uniref:Uncharacterized protein n=2 Tax=Kutzneria viridogrisea TaxID=47990 RepID=A0ABR6BGY9_9PSEU|nr:hypothetical protein [Kutzneria viridogrisea]
MRDITFKAISHDQAELRIGSGEYPTVLLYTPDQFRKLIAVSGLALAAMRELEAQKAERGELVD